jgi:hypothetical protein
MCVALQRITVGSALACAAIRRIMEAVLLSALRILHSAVALNRSLYLYVVLGPGLGIDDTPDG